MKPHVPHTPLERLTCVLFVWKCKHGKWWEPSCQKLQDHTVYHQQEGEMHLLSVNLFLIADIFLFETNLFGRWWMNYKQHTLECVFCQYKSQLLSPRWPTPAGLRTTLDPAVFWSHISCFTAQSAAAALKRMSPEITKEDWMNRKKNRIRLNITINSSHDST